MPEIWAWLRSEQSTQEAFINMDRPVFLEGMVLPVTYYDTPNPYKDPPEGNTNLLELSHYAKRVGKKLVELTREEVKQFTVQEKSNGM